MIALARKTLHSIGPLHRALSRHRGVLLHRPNYRPAKTSFLGHPEYGGWTIIPDLLSRESVVYSVGVGNDISFDLELIEQFGCEVNAFDPTPISLDWLNDQNVPAQFVLHPIGLGGLDESVPMGPPPAGGNCFWLPPEGAENVTYCAVRRLQTIMADLGHDRIDLLKMDIEGFEYPVIDDVLDGPIRPTQWLIEFHHLMRHFHPDQTNAAVARLEAAGYRLFSVSNTGREYSFIYRDAA